LANEIGKNKLTVSTGIIYGNELPDKPDDEGSFILDYNIWATSAQFEINQFTFSGYFFQNLQNQESNADIEAVYKDQKTGFSARELYKFHKFRFFYQYAYIENMQ